MSKIQSLQRDALTASPSTPGITRHLAFKGDDWMVLRARTDPSTVSGWHHHGNYDVYGYVVSGAVRLESRSRTEDNVSLGPGDFFHVSPLTVHRESNPASQEPNEVILFLHGTGTLVVNVGT